MRLLLLVLILPACGLLGGKDGGDDGDVEDGGSVEGVDADDDGYASVASGGEDCDDDDPSVHPFADELCNGQDDDCDGQTDEDAAVDALLWCADQDGDGWGNSDESDRACQRPDPSWVDQCGDCDDGDDRFHPEAVEDDCTDPADYNCDEHVDWADEDKDGTAACVDCDDTDPLRFDGASEVCDGVDNDCDDRIDDADDSLDLTTRTAWYPDEDHDGYGVGRDPVVACDDPGGHADNALDCDDGDALVNPGMTEICDDRDQDEDCSGLADDLDPDVATGGLNAWYRDADRDGHGAEDALPEYACDDPSVGAAVFSSTADDCDDDDPGVSPSDAEICDPAHTDQDCDGRADDLDDDTLASSKTTWYLDGDGDGFAGGTSTLACEDPSSAGEEWLLAQEDCDDGDPAIHPDATEVCDAADVDEDCDGLADDDDPSLDPDTATPYYNDADGDGFGDPGDITYACSDPGTDWVSDATDCDDADGDVHPGATEVCNDVDDDCDASTEATGVSFETTDGVLTTVTTSFTGGGPGTPRSWSSSEDGTLTFCGGTRYVGLNLRHDLTVVGRSGAVLNGGYGASVLTVTGSGTDVVVRDLTLTYGYRSSSTTGSTLGGGGGVHCYAASSLLLDGVTLTENSSTYGGGLYLERCDTTLIDSTLEQNYAPNYGGEIYLKDGDLTLENSRIVDHDGSCSIGTGIYAVGTTGAPSHIELLAGSEISGHRAGYGGAGVAMYAATLTCEDSAILDNTVTGTYSGYGGGGVMLSSSSANRLASSGCDWGTAARDNSPQDIYLQATNTGFSASSGTFSCTYSDCD